MQNQITSSYDFGYLKYEFCKLPNIWLRRNLLINKFCFQFELFWNFDKMYGFHQIGIGVFWFFWKHLLCSQIPFKVQIVTAKHPCSMDFCFIIY